MSGCYSNIVDKTESRRGILATMMTRRSYSSEHGPRVILIGFHGHVYRHPNRLHCATNSTVRLWTHYSIVHVNLNFE
jgi:hypothetical protein